MPAEVTTWGTSLMVTTIWSHGGARIPSPCDQLFFNAQLDGIYETQCGEGQIGSTVSYRVPAGKFASTVSQAAADMAAQAYMDVEGQKQANELGACYPDGKGRAYTQLQLATNWDWVANRDTDFPHYTSQIERIDYAGPNLAIPLLGLSPYAGAIDYINPADIEAKQLRFDGMPLGYDIHNTHGLMHINFKDYAPDQTNLVVMITETVGKYQGDSSNYFDPVMYNQLSYYGMLVGDFDSAEASGCRMGCGVFEFVTEDRRVEANGKVSGSYFATYKDRLYIWKYNKLTQDYEIISFDTYDHRGKTAYFQGVVHMEQSGATRAYVYINGVRLLAATDKKILYVMPCPYMRGAASRDYWFGDIFSGLVNICDPLETLPLMHVVYRQPSYIAPFPPTLNPEDGNKWYIPPTTVVGAATPEEANALPYSLGPGSAGKGFVGYWDNYKDFISEQAFGQTFAQAHLWTQFDYTSLGGLPKELLACTALIVHQFRSKLELDESVPGNNRQFLVPLINLYITPIQLPENPFMGGLYENSIWDAYIENGTDLIRDPCWSGLGAIPDVHPITPTYRWACDSIDLLPKNGVGLVKKEELAEYFYKPAAGWYDFRNFEHSYSEIRGFCLKTGAWGIRTTESLEAPVYSPPSCPVPISCSTVQMLASTVGVAGAVDGGLRLETFQQCDSLFEGLYSVPQGGWNWTIIVEDKYESQNVGTEEDPIQVYSNRYLKVILQSIPTELMADGLWNSSQIFLLNLTSIRVRLFLEGGTGAIDATGLLANWPLPIYEEVYPEASYYFNVPQQSPGGGPSGSPEITMIFNFPIPAAEGGDSTPPGPIALKEGYSYRVEIFRPHTQIPDPFKDAYLEV